MLLGFLSLVPGWWPGVIGTRIKRSFVDPINQVINPVPAPPDQTRGDKHRRQRTFCPDKSVIIIVQQCNASNEI